MVDTATDTTQQSTAASSEAQAPPPARFERSRSARGGGGGRDFRSRRKVCIFCVDKTTDIDYKDTQRLRRFLSDRGKIDPRRKTGTCAKHQRRLAVALKRARFMALLPFTGAHIRGVEQGGPGGRSDSGRPSQVRVESPADEVAAESAAVEVQGAQASDTEPAPEAAEPEAAAQAEATSA